MGKLKAKLIGCYNVLRYGHTNPIVLDGNKWKLKEYKSGPKYIQKK